MNRPRPLPRPERSRAVLYLRQSTHREESISLELQETAGREYCERRGYEVVAVESDPGISGRTWARPAVQRVMDMVERREVDVVVLWKWSRLSRARLDWAVAVDRVESIGGRIESATEPADTSTSAGRFQRGVLAEVAAMESERIGEQWKETIQRRVRMGLPGNGGARYGYDRAGDDYSIREDQAAILRAAYAHYVEDEWGWTKITRWLNEAGHTTGRGTTWDPNKIRLILDGGFAAGKIVTNRRRTSGEMTYHPGRHPAIIDEATWEAYLDRRRTAPRPPRQVEARTPFSGILRCADCGGPMRSAARSKGVAGYGCGTYLASRTGRYVTCTRASVEAFTRAWLREHVASLDADATADLHGRKPAPTPINSAASLDSKIASKTSALGAMTADHYSGKLSAIEYEAGRAVILSEISALDAQKRNLRIESSQRLDARAFAVNLDQYWDKLDPHEIRTMLAALLHGIDVVPPAVRKKGGAGPVTFRARPKWITEVVYE